MIKIEKRFLKNKKINWKATKTLFEAGLIHTKDFKDYIQDLITQRLDERAGVPPEIVEQIIFDNEISIESSENCRSSDRKKLNEDILLLAINNLAEVMKIEKTLDDPLIFREEIFELLKIFDFPKKEVEFFLSKIIDNEIEEEVTHYLNEHKFDNVLFN